MPDHPLRGRLPDEVVAYLEDRDRALENYLDLLAGSAVSVTSVTEQVWAPEPHASRHATTGDDWVTPDLIGAATPADVDAVQDDLDDHVTDPADAHDASAIGFTPAGTIAATDVQAAIEEVAAEAGGGGGHTIKDEGTPMTARAGLNFTGAGVTVTDDAGNDETDVTIPWMRVRDEGSLVAARGSIDFQGSGVTVTDDAVFDRSIATIPGETLPLTLYDAKGDLIVGTGADTAQRLAIGANGTVPVADSAQTTGILWTPRRYAVVQDESSDLTARGKLSFQGAGVAATDDSGGDRTVVTIPGYSPPFTAAVLRLTKGGSAQALTSGTAASLTWNTTTENTGSWDLPSSSTFSPPADGLYLVTATVAFSSSGGTTVAHVTRRIVALRNATDATNLEPQASTPSIPAIGQDTNVMLLGVYSLLAAKDYDIRARHDAPNNTPAAEPNSTLSIVRVA